MTVLPAVGDDKDRLGWTYSVAASGALAVTAIRPDLQVLTWFDRTGKPGGAVGAPMKLYGFSLSPDAKRVAVSRRDARSGRYGISVLDAVTGNGPRLTSDDADECAPQWSPDGAALAFTRNAFLRFRRTLGGGPEEQVLDAKPLGSPVYLSAWSPDGRQLMAILNDPVTRRNVSSIPLAGSRQPVGIVTGPANDVDGEWSPDGKWIAYASATQ